MDKPAKSPNSTSSKVILVVTFILVLTSFFTAQGLNSVQKDSLRNEITEIVNSSSRSTISLSLDGTYRGLGTLFYPNLRFPNMLLILDQESRFSLKAESFSLSVLAQNSLKVEDQYPVLNMALTGSFKATSGGQFQVQVDSLSLSFGVEEITLSAPETQRLLGEMKLLGLDLTETVKTPLKLLSVYSLNNRGLDLKKVDNGLILELEGRKI